MSAHTWRAEPGEAEIVGRLLVAFRNSFDKDWPSDNAMLASVERLFEDPNTVYLLGAPDEDSPPAAVCQLRFRDSVWTARPDAWLEDLWVEPEARRRGLGDALVRAACQVAIERGARRIELDTNESNTGAIALYERNGFSANSKGQAARDLFLGKRLPEPDD